MDAPRQGSKRIGFHTYADDTLRHEPAYEADRAADAWAANNPWGQDLHIRRSEAPHSERVEGAHGRSRLGPLLAYGALLCGAVVIGFVLARPDLRVHARHPAAVRVAQAETPPLQVADAASPPAAAQPAAAQPAAAPPPDVAPRGVRVEVEPQPSAPVGRVAGAAASTGASLRRAQPGPSERALSSADREAIALPQGAAPVRVFVHIADPAQRPAADRIRSELQGLRFADQPVATPPVRMVAASPGRTEVRCLKHADCAAAGRVARYLAQDLGAPVAVVDMSRTYEADPAVRPGSLELWLRSS